MSIKCEETATAIKDFYKRVKSIRELEGRGLIKRVPSLVEILPSPELVEFKGTTIIGDDGEEPLVEILPSPALVELKGTKVLGGFYLTEEGKEKIYNEEPLVQLISTTKINN